MVATRRRAGSTSTQDQGQEQPCSSLQEAPSSRARRSVQQAPTPSSKSAKKGAADADHPGEAQPQPSVSADGSNQQVAGAPRGGAKRAGAASRLPPVQEANSPEDKDEPQHTAFPAGTTRKKSAAAAAVTAPAAAPSSLAAAQPSPAPKLAAPVPARQPPSQLQPQPEIESTSGSDSEDDSDILGSGPMHHLAKSLRAAFSARVGTTNESAAPTTSEHNKEKTPANEDALRWKHEVAVPKLKQPARAGHQLGVTAEKETGLNKMFVAPPRDPSRMAKEAAKSAPETAGKAWFNLPATEITDDVKMQLRLLRLRGAYDTKRFYKTFDTTKFPKYFQIGTVVDSATDFYSSRLSARERGATITQELMADEGIKHMRKRRYNKLQEAAQKYQKVKKRKTDNTRASPKKHRPKH